MAVGGVRYFSPCDLSGYGQAAIANVRALVNAGVPVQWIPLDWQPDRMHVGQWAVSAGGQPRELLGKFGQHGHLNDLATLIAQTSTPIAYDTIVAHSPPEFWPHGFQRGKRNIGCTAWETDRSPAHWLPLLRQADHVVVPSTHNRDAFRRSGLKGPLSVIPHIRRHRWCEFSRAELAAVRDELGIPAHHKVFYSINTWSVRKAMEDLLFAFAQAFPNGEPVTLLVKTGHMGEGPGPFYSTEPTHQLASRMTARISEATGKAFPHFVLLEDTLDGDELDLIHAIGDYYVSLTHGEGWGLGAFEAATLGKPVLMTAWGGHTDYLGTTWPGAIPYSMVPVVLMPPHLPTYFPSQRWAHADVNAATELMRSVLASPEPALAAARTIRERSVERFAEPVVVQQWLEVLHG